MKEAFVSQAENDDIVKEVFIIFGDASSNQSSALATPPKKPIA